jgi:hypothetical protein
LAGRLRALRQPHQGGAGRIEFLGQFDKGIKELGASRWGHGREMSGTMSEPSALLRDLDALNQSVLIIYRQTSVQVIRNDRYMIDMLSLTSE